MSSVIKVASEKVSAVELVAAALEKAKKFAEYNVFTSLNEKAALAKAAEIDKKIARGEKAGRLAGVPYALKDNFSSREGKTTASAKMLENYRAPITATAVKKLEDEGAIMIGRTNLDAFAHGGSTENSYFGATANAHDKTRVAGGSSGGSATAVALDIVPFALGTDTGGSIRQPASFNGVYGMKPTFGAVSRYGVVAMASSTDTIGVLAQTAEDTQMLMGLLAGKDEKDTTTLDDFLAAAKSEKLKIGVISDFMGEGVDDEVAKLTKDYIEKLKKAGHQVSEVKMPILKYALAVYYVVVPAEVASNLSRYDGIRYGFRAKDAKTLGEIYSKSRDEGLMPENKRRILIGNFVLSSGFFDAYYLKAQKVRTLIIKAYNEMFAKYDVLVCPVAPTPAFKIGENTSDALKMYLGDIMTVPPSLAGLPALSVPAGKTASGLPIGVQLIGARRSDAILMGLAAEIEGLK
ncbi:MAG: Asp-tRNA(Asn)/Glu-tRNA(Gln) amidotransferase subunit GatA [Candidatus Nomurabacteria bacterium]|jgi:aspartyl-tRNA(Asn)/glutamyl-tRNA(Gln) amidotransferase subunit A|nr:Asp-tRNA(Asn)/Glu-tRNA(Gln) amidotransferase subunit GatA [Candidatus Nomurabacteria bacterium]